jgi:hypothetical protein
MEPRSCSQERSTAAWEMVPEGVRPRSASPMSCASSEWLGEQMSMSERVISSRLGVNGRGEGRDMNWARYEGGKEIVTYMVEHL